MVAFQPHRYTRTRDLFEDFAEVLSQVDVLLLTEVYPAGEAPIEGINRDTYADALRGHGHRNVITIEGEDDLAAAIAPFAKSGGAIVMLGAGSISAWAANLQAALEKQGGQA